LTTLFGELNKLDKKLEKYQNVKVKIELDNSSVDIKSIENINKSLKELAKINISKTKADNINNLTNALNSLKDIKIDFTWLESLNKLNISKSNINNLKSLSETATTLGQLKNVMKDMGNIQHTSIMAFVNSLSSLGSIKINNTLISNIVNLSNSSTIISISLFCASVKNPDAI
jgi:hypothetical protein